MKTKFRRTLCLLAAATALLPAGAKKPLDHTCFDDWKRLVVNTPSNDGRWVVYQANAQEGDGTLYLHDMRKGTDIAVPRGYNPSFTADSKWAVALVKPLHQQTRKAKIDKKAEKDMPKDSLAIINLTTGQVEMIPNVLSFAVGKEGGDWLAYQSCDTAYVSPKALGDTKSGRPLMLRNLQSKVQKQLKWVKDYGFSKDGSKLALTMKHHSSDSTATDGVGVVMLPDTAFIMIDRDKKQYNKPVFDESGSRMAWLATNDSIETGTLDMHLYTADLQRHELPVAEEIVMQTFGTVVPNLNPADGATPELQAELEARRSEAIAEARKKGFRLNQYSKPLFSHDGKRLVVGVAPIIPANDTTIVEFETPKLDIWRWDAPYTPPQEQALLKQIRENTYPVVIDLTTGRQEITADNVVHEVKPSDRWDGDWVMLLDPAEFQVSRQWDYLAPTRLYLKNTRTGEVRNVGIIPRDEGEMSPAGKYVAWFDDRNYYVYDIADGVTRCLTEEMEFPLWKEEQDIPLKRQPYGNAGWTAGDEAFLVYDSHDIWSLDPKGVRKPLNLTAGDGRKNGRRYRYVNVDPERRFVSPKDVMLLSVFDYGDKKNGLATLAYTGQGAAPKLRTLEPAEFLLFRKAKDADVIAFRKSSFETSPDMWVATGYDFANAKKISDINPQMKEYSWGTAHLESWYAYNGQKTEGVIYLPEDYDPQKKYPMLTVFYETGSEELYHHYEMEPSWSWVNYPFYVSRGYIIFQPDIHYAPGVPGESAYNYVCSGVEAMCKKYTGIDKDRLGIDGQSWGGYQTAFLVTRTDMFACAGSGAPVSNMTSAFGGIRWGSGDSRQAQYEQGQSRIGRNLWDNTYLYMANSPIFFADRVHTPLLIMHNDADGAVPWYQGIEYFMALRRLGKPVWMLNYNGEAHNLKLRHTRKDITVRLQQFFDHYLKGDPMPAWMKEGIDPLRKGQELGY